MMSRCQRLKWPHWAYRLLCGGNPAVWATQILSSWVNWVGKASISGKLRCILLHDYHNEGKTTKNGYYAGHRVQIVFFSKVFQPKGKYIVYSQHLEKFLTRLKPMSCFTHEPRSFCWVTWGWLQTHHPPFCQGLLYGWWGMCLSSLMNIVRH